MSELRLTCPDCCYDALKRVKKHRWKCEECGTSFDLAKLRNSLDLLVCRSLPGEFISELLKDATLERAEEFGECSYKWAGRYGVLYVIDSGNDWWTVLRAEAP